MNADTVPGAEGSEATDRQFVLLVGGPPGLPSLYRSAVGSADNARIVVAFYGRHQHFEDTGGTQAVGDRQVPVYRFTYSTAIAE